MPVGGASGTPVGFTGRQIFRGKARLRIEETIKDLNSLLAYSSAHPNKNLLAAGDAASISSIIVSLTAALARRTTV
jgi:hypothetical protein